MKKALLKREGYSKTRSKMKERTPIDFESPNNPKMPGKKWGKREESGNERELTAGPE